MSFTVLCTPAAAGPPWRLQKRFSDFEALRAALAAAVPPPHPYPPPAARRIAPWETRRPCL